MWYIYTFRRCALACASLFVTALSWSANSAYISRVYEYRPAPGQFTNLMPAYVEGDDAESMRSKAEETIAENNRGLISLGAWGGYIVFGFDHPVVNDKGNYDLLILGNAFYSNPSDPAAGGSAEPGIVMVSYDANGNGLPDDTWYELAGSGHASATHNYELTYYKTPSDHVATPDNDRKYLIDTTHVAWTDNKGHQGHIYQLAYHKQPYYPQWLDDEQLVFTGTRLPDNGVYDSERSLYVQYAFDYGYVDNHPNDTEAAKLKLDWAVKADGTPANLTAIHFVKVYNGILQQYGTTGETSTEIMGAEDLHPDMVTALTDIYTNQQPSKTIRNGQICIIRPDGVFNLTGQKIQTR